MSRKKRKTRPGQVQASRWARIELCWVTRKAMADQARIDALMDILFEDRPHWHRRPPFEPYWCAPSAGDAIGYGARFETLRACVAALEAAGFGSYTLGPHRVRLRSRYVAGDRPPP